MKRILAALALSLPCAPVAQTVDMGAGARLHYQGNAGAIVWSFPAEGGKVRLSGTPLPGLAQ